MAEPLPAELEVELTKAVRASVWLEASERPGFIGRYLLAVLEGTPLPTSIWTIEIFSGMSSGGQVRIHFLLCLAITW